VVADTAVSPGELRSHSILLIGDWTENGVTELAADSIRPYYDDGEPSVGGMRWAGQGLALTIPNPLAPGYLLGFIDAPQSLLPDSAAVASWFHYFPFRFRSFWVDERASYPGFCPDVMVLTPHPIKDAWSGWFDRNWENLVGHSP
jgi:hypothetical protein